MPPLQTYQIPNPDNKSKAREVAQELIAQAEEDLFCALGCWRHNPHEPFNEICYLLHQSLEKWIKVALQMSYGSFRRSHNLGVLLRPLCTNKLGVNKQKKKRIQGPELDVVMEILGAEPVLIGKNYPDQIRYRESDTNDYDLKNHVRILFKAVCRVRQLVKCWLVDRVKE